jgi:hypothetical protein
MKDYIRQILEGVEGDLRKICLVREYLQARILQGLQDAGAFTEWAFHGGTALRFLYSIPRFSEDLDFSLVRTGGVAHFEEALDRCRKAFEAEGYAVRTTVNARKTVNSAFLRFPGLLYELDLSPRRTQALSVKVELDTNPPEGGGLDTTITRRHVLLRLHHHDKASLLAGKLHALLTRPWAKGRDLYDLVWYLADPDWPEPNLALLNAALDQTGWEGGAVTRENWRGILADRLKALDWEAVRDDVRPFLERAEDLALIDPDAALLLLRE